MVINADTSKNFGTHAVNQAAPQRFFFENAPEKCFDPKSAPHPSAFRRKEGVRHRGGQLLKGRPSARRSELTFVPDEKWYLRHSLNPKCLKLDLRWQNSVLAERLMIKNAYIEKLGPATMHWELELSKWRLGDIINK